MIKKPLVLTNGEIEQLQPGDSLSPGLILTNEDIIDLPVCAPVFISSANKIKHADGTTNPNVIGLLTQPTIINAQGAVQTNNKITALTTDWDLLTGQTGGLTPGAIYYLGSVGGLTIVIPTTGFLVRLGIAVNSTDFEIKISRPIKL